MSGLLFPGVGTGKFKPFDVLAEQFTSVNNAYKDASDNEQRKELLSIMRLILDEADSLHAITLQNLMNR